jgi:hypothetical protein
MKNHTLTEIAALYDEQFGCCGVCDLEVDEKDMADIFELG